MTKKGKTNKIYVSLSVIKIWLHAKLFSFYSYKIFFPKKHYTLQKNLQNWCVE